VEAENAFAGIGATLGLVGHSVCPALDGVLCFRAGGNYALVAPSSPSVAVPVRRADRGLPWTPPFLLGHPRQTAGPFPIPLSVPISIKSFKVPRCPDAGKLLPASFPNPAPRGTGQNVRGSLLAVGQRRGPSGVKTAVTVLEYSLRCAAKRFPNPTPKPPRELLLHDVPCRRNMFGSPSSRIICRASRRP